ncbi:MAG: hypothetical protein L0216_08935 [Planctomycetales bacterium]|nr:hypothetical protein [Planctomycetales bacterium]
MERASVLAAAIGVATAAAGCETEPPVAAPQRFGVAVAEPRGERIVGQTVRVHGYVVGGQASEVRVGDLPATVDPGGHFEASVPVGEDGPRRLPVVAKGPAGEVRSEAAWVADNTPPLVTIESPAPDEVFTREAAAVEIRGRVEDGSPVSLAADGRPVALDGTRFLLPVMLGEGERTVRLVARDAAGHESAVAVKISRDTTPPSVALGEVPAEVRRPEVPVQGTLSEAGCRVFANGIGARVDGVSFEVTVPLDEGENAIAIVARDAAGNEGSAAAKVLYRLPDPPSEEIVIETLRRQIVGDGGGWYEGQYRHLLDYGPAIRPIILEVVRKVLTGNDRSLAPLQTHAVQMLGDLNMTEGAALLREILTTYQLPPDFRNEVAFIMSRLGDSEEADKILADYRKGLDGTPQQKANAWTQLGNAYARMNNFRESRDCYLKHIQVLAEAKLPPRPSSIVYYNLACQHAKLGDKDLAIAALQKCMELGYTGLEWMAMDGDLASLRSDQRFQDMLAEKATPRQLLARAKNVFDRTHPEPCRKLLEKVVAQDPSLGEAWIYLAQAKAFEGNQDGAIEALEKAVEAGWRDKAGTLGDTEAFKRVRANPRFQAAVAAVQAPLPPKEEGQPPGEEKQDVPPPDGGEGGGGGGGGS